MAVKVKNKKGNMVTLLNPSEKREKFFQELNNGIHITNDSEIKFKKNGKPRKLTDTEKAYRAGYIQAQNDSAKCHNARVAKAEKSKAKTTKSTAKKK